MEGNGNVHCAHDNTSQFGWERTHTFWSMMATQANVMVPLPVPRSRPARGEMNLLSVSLALRQLSAKPRPPFSVIARIPIDPDDRRRMMA